MSAPSSPPQPAPHVPEEQQTMAGMVGRAMEWAFGKRIHKLTEELTSAHPLSYVLIVCQSIAVVLVIGHSELTLLLSPDPLIRGTAALALAVLVATVWAADICVLEVLKRIPVLWRNQQSLLVLEHLAYLLLVLTMEGVTFGIVLATLDNDPRALFSDKPLIPDHGPLWLFQIVMRPVVIVWTVVQLFLVRGKLAPQWNTLITAGRELMGGHALEAIKHINVTHASAATLIHTYGEMSRPPVRYETPWNRWLVRREQHKLKQEQEQMDAVIKAISPFETMTPTMPQYALQPLTPPLTALSERMARSDDVASPWTPPDDPSGGPTNGGQPLPVQTAAGADGQRREMTHSNVRPFASRQPSTTPSKTAGKTPSQSARRSVRPVAGRTGRNRAELEQLRAARLRAAETIMAKDPTISVRILAKRIAIATKNSCSESTAHAIRSSILASNQASNQAANLARQAVETDEADETFETDEATEMNEQHSPFAALPPISAFP